MKERIYLISLFDLYKNLLTEKQRYIFSKYYLEDLSLSEISEIENISRSAIFDFLKKSEDKLFYYEKNIGFYKYIKERGEDNV